MPKEIKPNLNEEDKGIMEKLLSAGNIEHKFAVRVQTVLHRANGKATGAIAEYLGIAPVTVSTHVKRYNEYGLEGLLRDKTRKPGKEPISQEQKEELCRIACTEKPKDQTHWSVRTLAKRVGIGKTAVNGILNEWGIKPHIVTKAQYSTDPEFENKLRDVVGLYMSPPKNAIILCVDEKTQIQALERTQPILPMLRNVPERQTVDYDRRGTTSLFAALDVMTGKVIGECKERHRSEDYIEFLKKVNKKCAKGKELHIIADNLSAHKTQAVKDYLAEEKGRWVVHYIPTHSSWLNLVERWFAEITNKRIRRESWESVEQLIAAIKRYIKTWNKSRRRFTWTKEPDEILRKVRMASSPIIHSV
jgi:transposase